MAELRDLYQELILEHAKAPRNYRELGEPAAKAEGYNPLCGDRCTVFINAEGGVIHDIAFQGNGCAISKASASLRDHEGSHHCICLARSGRVDEGAVAA